MAEDFMTAAVKRVEAQFEKSGVSENCSSSLSDRKKNRNRRGQIITVSARQAEARDTLNCWKWRA